MKTVELGRIGKAHGLRGEVRVKLHWPESDLIASQQQLLLRRDDGQECSYAVEGTRGGPGGLLLKLAGVEDREQARALTGSHVCVPRSELPSLPSGEYYLADLVGTEVDGPAGCIGEVVEVRIHPSVDAVVIRCSDGRLVEQALVEPWLDEVDVERGRLKLSSLDGLIE